MRPRDKGSHPALDELPEVDRTSGAQTCYFVDFVEPKRRMMPCSVGTVEKDSSCRRLNQPPSTTYHNPFHQTARKQRSLTYEHNQPSRQSMDAFATRPNPGYRSHAQYSYPNA